MLMSDEKYLLAAYDEALKSGDLSTQNGAVLVNPDDGEIVARGWNDIHLPLIDKQERRIRPAKYEWTEHAERMAIFNAGRAGRTTWGLWLFCPWFACADCARAIVYAGITRVVGRVLDGEETHSRWAASCETGDQMLREASVEFVRIRIPNYGIRLRRNESLIEV